MHLCMDKRQFKTKIYPNNYRSANHNMHATPNSTSMDLVEFVYILCECINIYIVNGKIHILSQKK